MEPATVSVSPGLGLETPSLPREPRIKQEGAEMGDHEITVPSHSTATVNRKAPAARRYCRDHRRNYQERWRSEYLMEYDGLRHGLVCMVCGSSLATLKISTIKRHILQRHQASLLLTPAEKDLVIGSWDQHVLGQCRLADGLPLQTSDPESTTPTDLAHEAVPSSPVDVNQRLPPPPPPLPLFPPTPAPIRAPNRPAGKRPIARHGLGPGVGVGARLGPATGVGFGSEARLGPGAAVGPKPGFGPVPRALAGPKHVTRPGVGCGAVAGPGLKPGARPHLGSGLGLKTEPGFEPEIGLEPGAGLGPQLMARPGPGPKQVARPGVEPGAGAGLGTQLMARPRPGPKQVARPGVEPRAVAGLEPQLMARPGPGPKQVARPGVVPGAVAVAGLGPKPRARAGIGPGDGFGPKVAGPGPGVVAKPRPPPRKRARRYYQERWRSEYLMAYNGARHWLVCMVCGSSLATLKLSTIKRHILQKHQASLSLTAAQRHVVLATWADRLASQPRGQTRHLLDQSRMDAVNQSQVKDLDLVDQSHDERQRLVDQSHVEHHGLVDQSHVDSRDLAEQMYISHIDQSHVRPPGLLDQSHADPLDQSNFGRHSLADQSYINHLGLVDQSYVQRPDLLDQSPEGLADQSDMERPALADQSQVELPDLPDQSCIDPLGLSDQSHVECPALLDQSYERPLWIDQPRVKSLALADQSDVPIGVRLSPVKQSLDQSQAGSLALGQWQTGAATPADAPHPIPFIKEEDCPPPESGPPSPSPSLPPPLPFPLPLPLATMAGVAVAGRSYQERWRTDHLMDFDPERRVLVCMVCGRTLATLTLATINRHVRQSHPHSLDFNRAEKENILEAWREQAGRPLTPSGKPTHLYRESWRLDFLVELDRQRGRLVCMVCGKSLATLSLGAVKRHVLHNHPHSLNFSHAARQNILETWSQTSAWNSPPSDGTVVPLDPASPPVPSPNHHTGERPAEIEVYVEGPEGPGPEGPAPARSRRLGRDHRRNYQECWRLDYLMDHDRWRHGLVCMVCGATLATLKLSTIKRHILQRHQESLGFSLTQKVLLAQEWSRKLAAISKVDVAGCLATRADIFPRDWTAGGGT